MGIDQEGIRQGKTEEGKKLGREEIKTTQGNECQFFFSWGVGGWVNGVSIWAAGVSLSIFVHIKHMTWQPEIPARTLAEE